MVVAVADFFDGEGHDWKSSKAKMFEFAIKKGYDLNKKCSVEQLNTLRVFGMTGITNESVMPKSRAAGGFAEFLLQCLELQEKLHALPEDEVKAGLPDVEGVNLNIEPMRSRTNEGLYGSAPGGGGGENATSRKNQADDLYYTRQTTNGKKVKHSRKRSAGYQAPTTSSNKKAGV